MTDTTRRRSPGNAKGKLPPLVKADFEALSEFRYQLRRFLRFSEEAARAEGLKPQQYQLMLHIKGFPGREWATIGELAGRLQTQQHGVVALVSRCEAAGLVVRSRDTADRRKVLVGLTATGEKCLRRLAERHRLELLSLSTVIGVAHVSALSDRVSDRVSDRASVRASDRVSDGASDGASDGLGE